MHSNNIRVQNKTFLHCKQHNLTGSYSEGKPVSPPSGVHGELQGYLLRKYKRSSSSSPPAALGGEECSAVAVVAVEEEERESDS